MSSLAPGLLIAAPPLADPNFDRAVVLLASHDRDGAFGWVVNGNCVMSVSELLLRADISSKEVSVPGQVRKGGPVSPEQVWLVYPTGQRVDGVDGQFEVAPGISATASRTFLERLAEGAHVPGMLAFAGYAGWGPSQLETEIRAGGWLPAPVRADLVLETGADDLWQKAYESLGTTPIAFTSKTVGSA